MASPGNGGGDESGDGGDPASNREEHEDQDNGPVLAHNTFVFVVESRGEQAAQDFLAVEREDGDEVEDGEHDVHLD